MHSHWNFGGRRGRHGHGGHLGGGHGFFGRFGGLMGGGNRFRAARMLASGDLQLIILHLLNEKPRHGYDIIKALEDLSSGIYTPSPGVVYPALTYLEEVGHASSQAEGNKKLFTITDAGKEHLEKNRQLVEDTLEQLTRFGRKMARLHRHFEDEEAENDVDNAPQGNRDEWRKMKMELHKLKDELKEVLREKIRGTAEERERVMEILRKAIKDIRSK